MWRKLQSFNADAIGIDEAIGLIAYGKQLKATYSEYVTEIPEWLSIALKSLDRIVRDKIRDDLDRQIALEEASLLNLRTKEEVKKDKEANLKRLKEIRDGSLA